MQALVLTRDKTMKNSLVTVVVVASVFNLGIFAYAMSNKISQNVTSKNLINSRNNSLENIAKHFKSDTCWELSTKESNKIGDILNTDGTEYGKIPTSCIYSKNQNQFLDVAYENGQLKIKNIFSKTELRNQLSKLQKGKNND
jgi:hypothetical protein